MGDPLRQSDPAPAADEVPMLGVLGTPLRLTTYAGFTEHCTRLSAEPRVSAVDFTNTMIVTLRRHDPGFRTMTGHVDYFVPDGMPLIWCLNLQGAALKDRVYGPAFMRYCLTHVAPETTHFFLGGSAECLERLKAASLGWNPRLRIVGTQHGYFTADDEPAIVERINGLSPGFVWIGLGTPKQQEWIHRWRGALRRGVVLAVGFAFDVNAGTKRDAPLWMQQRGLTWVYRLCSEPRRLGGRYLRYNSLFLWYLLVDGLRGRAFGEVTPPVHSGPRA